MACKKSPPVADRQLQKSFLFRRSRLQPVFYGAFWLRLVVARSHWIVFIFLLVGQNGTNPLHGRLLKHSKPFDASTTRNRRVLPNQESFLQPLLQDALDGRLLLW